jgi:signal transduction histidine kinase
VGNLGSFIRSAARGTSSGYRRIPIRWRLAGGSAALTLVILCGFATIVGVLTTERIESDFNREVSAAADRLQRQVAVRWEGLRPKYAGPNLDAIAVPQNAVIRVITARDETLESSSAAPDLGAPQAEGVDREGYRIETRLVLQIGTTIFTPDTGFYLQYARPLSDVKATARKVQLFLAFGVLGGAALALLAGLATARRAMAPIAELTDAARTIARTRDPSLKIPHPEAEDEVAELARTLDSMLQSLNAARSETEAALMRQREFVADASHELRTPLTSVLANLELLEEVLDGEPREAAASALRSSQRMRRLVADLLLLARADAGRIARHEPLDLSRVVVEVAGELEPVAGDHEIRVSAASGATVSGARDELHRLALNLMENALRHTDPGTAVEATVERRNGQIVLSVEDDGPGIPAELREKVFERFYRGESDHGGSSGLGLSIVRAVAESHQGSVTLEEPLDGRGARFVVTLPAAR